MAELMSLLKIEGPPGSGKTRMLAREACRLVVEEGLDASRLLILAMTSLNKQRLESYLKIESAQAGVPGLSFRVLTWEAWLLECLQSDSPHPGRSFQLIQDSDARVLLQEILRQVILPGQALYHASRQPAFGHAFFVLIRQWQLQGLTDVQLSAFLADCSISDDSRLPLVVEIYRKFAQHLHSAGLLCHPELVQRVHHQRCSNAQLGSGCYQAVLVDEAQELSKCQHQLLAGMGFRLVFAGNERLSIRSFRGAKPECFETLALYERHACTFLPQQACLRNNEAILSLLNGLLPMPIWEEQQPNRDQLQEMVQFGLFLDANDEADGLARWIARFVQTAHVENRPARWDDCVILLRSTHYQPNIVQALLKQGIPFCSDLASEALIRFQHFFYDLLQVFHSWAQLDITPAQLQSASLLESHLAGLNLPVVQQQDLYLICSRALLRWMEAALPLASLDEGFEKSSRDKPMEEDACQRLLWLLDPAVASPAQYTALQKLVELYRLYDEASCPVMLLTALAQMFQSQNEHETGNVQAGVVACRRNLERLSAHYQATFAKNVPLQEILAGFSSLWNGWELVTGSGLDGGAIRLMSIHQVQGETFPFVAIPFLVSGEFPLTRDMPEIILENDLKRLDLPKLSDLDELEEARLLAVGMSRASQQVWLSCHEQEAGLPVLPSAFYVRLVNHKRALLGVPGTGLPYCIEDKEKLSCDLAVCHYHPGNQNLEQAAPEELNDPLNRYVGESVWANLKKEPTSALYASDEVVLLSASSIKTYMNCPRQFYYRHVLRLPQPGSEAASLGSLIHRVMEVFNTQATTQSYTAERLKSLAEALFCFDTEAETFFDMGFGEQDLHELQKLSPLTLTTLRRRLLESIDDLERKGYFERYGNLLQVQPEKKLEAFALEGLERCRFSGTVDALIQKADGRWDILDYKTFRSAYAVGLDTCENRFRETLDPLPEDEAMSHAERFAGKLSATYPKDYQLPLYYLACEQESVYRGQLDAVALQMIRPCFPENVAQGAIRLELTAEEIEAVKKKMTEDIRKYIVDPILDSMAFKTNPSRMTCGHCGYAGLCDEENSTEEGELA